MEIKDILAKLSDNSEMVDFVNSLNDKATGANDLILKVNKLESQKQEIIDSRKNQDTKYSEMLKLLGVDELTPEAVNGFNDRLNAKGDDKFMNEINSLKDLLEKSNGEKSTMENDYKGKIQNMALDNAIINAGVGSNVANEAMLTIVTGLVKDGAVYEDNKIVYKKKDGSTMYDANNAPMTIESKMNSLKSDANYAGLFKADAKGGSGSQGSQGQGGVNTENMNPTEMMKAGRK